MQDASHHPDGNATPSSSQGDADGLLARLRAWFHSTFSTNEPASSSPVETPAAAPVKTRSPADALAEQVRLLNETVRADQTETRSAVLEAAAAIETLSTRLDMLPAQHAALTARLDKMPAQHEELTARLDKLPAQHEELSARLGELPDRFRAHDQALREISDRLEASDHRVEELAAIATQIPKMAEKGAGSLEEIKSQLRRTLETDTEMRTAVQALHGTLGELIERSATHDETLQRIDENAGVRERMLTDMIETQNKRFGHVMWLMVFALAVALAMALIQAFVLFSNGPS